MVRTTLVGPDLAVGAEVVRLLEEARFPFTVAMWLLKNPESEWEFTIGSPLQDKAGPRSSYKEYLAAVRPLDFDIINELRTRILGNKNPLIRGLRRAYGKGKPVEGRRLRGPAPGSKIWIEDSYVYRIK